MQRIIQDILHGLYTILSWIISIGLFMNQYSDSLTRWISCLVSLVVSYYAIKYYRKQLKKDIEDRLK